MSAEAREQVWGNLDGVPAAVAVIALALADVANDMHGNALFASVDTIAAKTGRDRRTVQRALADLVRLEWLTEVGTRPNGVREYRWNGPKQGRRAAAPRGGEVPQGGGEAPPHGGGEAPPEPKKPNVNHARTREAPFPNEPMARFIPNRSTDRARCDRCADSGWIEVFGQAGGQVTRCPCSPPVRGNEHHDGDLAEARRRSLQALRAMREHDQIGAP